MGLARIVLGEQWYVMNEVEPMDYVSVSRLQVPGCVLGFPEGGHRDGLHDSWCAA